MFATALPSTSVHAQALDESGNAGGAGADATTEDGETCAVEKIGWILCPIMEGASTIADKTFSILANNFLQVEPQLLGEGSSGTKTAWESARNLANIMFVIAFLIIIYSQITGSGLNNYGIKRMLPRLIIAAIAVNLSFFICQIMVDLSNIMGFAIKEFLSNEAARLGPSVLGGASQGTDTQTSGGILASISSSVLVAGGLVWLFLGPFFLIVTAVLITAITVILILLLRKAILVILVVVSPIAFVMYLLPNTEKLFSKWLNMFWGLLMVFPVVASLFGGGQLASTIILMAGAGKTTPPTTSSEQCSAQQEKDAANKTQKQKDEEAVRDGYSVPCEGVVSLTNPSSPDQPIQAGWMLGLVATGIAVAPLLAVWAVLKGALAAAGAIGGKIAANVQKGSQKGIGGGAKYAGDKYKDSTWGKHRARQSKIDGGNIKAGEYKGKNPIKHARSRINRGFNSIDENNLGSIGKNYSAQRKRDALGERSSRAREKGEEFAGSGKYIEEFDKNYESYLKANTDAEREEAEVYLNGAMIAASRLDDREALSAMRSLHNSRSPNAGAYKGMDSAGKESFKSQKSVASTAITQQQTTGQAQARQAAPQMPSVGSGGGAPSTNQPTNQQAQRLSFNSTGTNGGIVAKSGHNVIGQVENAGGFSALSNDDLINAGRHAVQNQGGDGHDALGQKVVDELQSRGIDPNQHL
ncbi:hypothetical protein EON76_01635 [bacterium]|nr:MAG: hypothetical protein EON76_01635 [bacterium]